MKKLINLMCAMLVSVYKVQEQEQEVAIARGDTPMPEETSELKELNDTIQEAQVYMTALKGGEIFLLELTKEELEFLVVKWKEADRHVERMLRDLEAVVKTAEILTHMGEDMDSGEKTTVEKVRKGIEQGKVDLKMGKQLLRKLSELQTA